MNKTALFCGAGVMILMGFISDRQIIGSCGLVLMWMGVAVLIKEKEG